MGAMFTAAWDVLNTQINVPWIGNTSPLLMLVYLGVLSVIVDFITSSRGDRGD